MIAADDGVKTRVWDRAAVPAAVSLLTKLPSVIGHNATFYDRVAIKTVYDVNLKVGDTMLMAYLLDEEAGQRKRGDLELESLAIKYLGVDEWKSDVTWDWNETDEWYPEDPRWDVMRRYCARDTHHTKRLADVLAVRLRDEGLWSIYADLLLPASRALALLEETGVHVSLENLERAREEFQVERVESEAKLIEAGLAKPTSTKDLGDFLFNRCRLTPTHYTPTGKPATHELALKTLKKDGRVPEIVDSLLKFRGASKMLSTYIKPYEEKSKRDGRVHPSYSLTFTVTGRTSAFNPNVQNVPRDTRVRSIVAAPQGHSLLQVDLSQAELRIAAFLSRDAAMLDAFRRGDDLHYLMAEKVTGKRRDEITKEERTAAKIANFSLVYCAETGTFMDQAFKDYGVVFEYAEADRIRNAFFKTWAGLIPWYKSVYAELMEKEYVTSRTGRRRRFPHFKTYTDYNKTECLRQAVNFGVQSLASDIALTALVLVTGMGYKTTAYIHDAVQVEVKADGVERAAREIKEAVEKTVPLLMAEKFGVVLDVPMKADVSVGNDWGHLEEIL